MRLKTKNGIDLRGPAAGGWEGCDDFWVWQEAPESQIEGFSSSRLSAVPNNVRPWFKMQMSRFYLTPSKSDSGSEA